MAEIEGHLGVSALQEVLDSHLLPSEETSALRRDDYLAFIAERKEIVVEALSAQTKEPGEPGQQP